jgi:hypothetical protein
MDDFLREPFEPGPEHTRAFFEARINEFVRALVHCQSEARLTQIQERIAYLSQQWEQTYATTRQLSRPDLLELITLREQRLTPLIRDLERRFAFGR